MSIGSIGIPKAAVVLGTVTPPQGDVIDLRIHLGCTKEVSSFEVTLQNWNEQYSPGGSSPILVGADGHIDVGRGTNVPALITCRVENIEYDSPTAEEHYLKVTGRCWGERLFRSIVNKSYVLQKGEAIVKDLMDSFVGLSHNRSGTELVQTTSTTYTELDYENTPLLDILKHIAETADNAGVIGYDFRVAPDGKFEFFPRGIKAASLSLAGISEITQYKKDISRIRNKIFTYGFAGKVLPASLDSWTESLTGWTSSDGTLSLDSVNKVYGTYSIYCQGVYASPFLNVHMRLALSSPVKCGGHSGYQTFNYAVRRSGQLILGVQTYLYTALIIRLMTSATDYFEKIYTFNTSDQQNQKWQYNTDQLGRGGSGWVPFGSPDWANINYIEFNGVGSPGGVGSWIALNIDKLFFDKGRFSAVEEDSASEAAYGIRILCETDEELVSDSDCDLRAKSLLAYWKDPDEYLKVSSTVLDYGLTPVLAGDTVHATFPNENVDADYRVETVEYFISKDDENTLEVTFELGKVPPLLTDYMYGLRSTTVTVEKLARTKLGEGQVSAGLGGGGAGSGGLVNHHVSHEVGDVNGVQYSGPDVGGWDPLIGWIAPNFIGPLSDTAAIINFRTKNKAGSASVDHQFQPSNNEYGIFGLETNHWKEMHAKLLTLYEGMNSPWGRLWIKIQGDVNPLVSLAQDYLQFGVGGAFAPDTWLHRVGPGEFEIKNDLVPTGDNAGKIGYGGVSPLRWSEIHAVDIYGSQFHWTGNLIPDADNAYDIGESTTPKRWRDIYLAGAIKALAGGCSVHFLPNADNTYNLGAPGTRWGNLYVAALADLGWLNIGGTLVISNTRVLQNITMDASLITTGKLNSLSRLPNGTAGYVLEAEGASDPMYVNPNGRYTPAGHNHAAGDITSGVLAEARCPNVYSGLITFNGGINSNGYKISGTPGVSGSFTTVDGKTVTVNNGIITSIV